MASSGCVIHFVVSFHGHGWPEFKAESQSALLNPTVEALNNPSLPDPVSIERRWKWEKGKGREKGKGKKGRERQKDPHNHITSQWDKQSSKKHIFKGRFPEYLHYQFSSWARCIFSLYLLEVLPACKQIVNRSSPVLGGQYELTACVFGSGPLKNPSIN